MVRVMVVATSSCTCWLLKRVGGGSMSARHSHSELSRLKACLLQMLSCSSVTAQSATLVMLPDMPDPGMPIRAQGDCEKLVQ